MYGNPQALLGRSVDHPVVLHNQKHFPYKVVPVEGNLSGIFHDVNTTFLPEEIIAMIFRHAQFIIHWSTGINARSATITVSIKRQTFSFFILTNSSFEKILYRFLLI
jgi:molecular chaperone DnaK (HSP70)